MNWISRILSIALLGIMSASCLTIKESYVFKKNGSGTMHYQIDMSEMAMLLKSAIEEDEEASAGVSEMDLSDIAAKLSDVSGISNVKHEQNMEEFIFDVSFKFKDIQSLNEALSVVFKQSEESGQTPPSFSWDGNKVTRTHSLSGELTDGFLDGEDEESEQARMFLGQMTYEIDYTFAKPIKVVYGPESAQVGGKKDRELKVSSSFLELAETQDRLGTTIVLK
ncbi:hypothetical protein [Pontibacter sp. G13]|uniref:hypothetical protein n=1 Tax=Pontibacter sp. G13 TaxID=3074898 RepID=UPI00288B7D28|nr:hypothetical protein [Pontibacter sp. G13]WNJ19721.1 hypothetical protein RJD25_04495 [Pontibacter sp. G13]